jgi:hypothetical protein
MENMLRKYKWLILYFSLILGLQVYSNAKGWRFLGSNTEKWAPQGYQQNHK